MLSGLFYRKWILLLLLTAPCFSSSTAQNIRTGKDVLDASFSGAAKVIQSFDSKTEDVSDLIGLVLAYNVPAFSHSRADDYYLLVQKIAQLKKRLSELKNKLVANADAQNKDAFETTEQYKARLNRFEQQVKSEYAAEIEPLVLEADAFTKRNYKSITPSSLTYSFDVASYNADQSIWSIPIRNASTRTSININVQPALAKQIWDNRGLIAAYDITDIYGKIKYTEIGIPSINWKIFVEYNYSPLASKSNVSTSKQISIFPETERKKVKIDEVNIEVMVEAKVVPVPQDGDRVYTVVEVEAQFPGGDAAWSRFVQREVEKRIDELTDDGRSGTCEVQFIVDTEGVVSSVEALTMKGTKLAEVTINAIKKGPKWVPAIQNGRKVKAWRKQKVSFRLPDE